MTTLTDRYLAATLRSVPVARREEIATELRGSIEDMIDGRTAGGQDATTAEREVLTELGDPAQLAARYSDRRLQLIGPTYYLAWERLLKLLLSFVPATVGILVGLLAAADGDNPGGAIGEGVATALSVALHIAFWVTLVFAVLERTKTPLHLPRWSVDQLPEGPVDRQITLTDTAASIGFLTLFIAYLPVQHFRSFVPTDGEKNLPILDPALWSFWLPFLITVLVATVGLEIAKYRTGRWTWPLVTVNAALNLAFAVPVIWLMSTDRLLNPDLVNRFEWLNQGDNLNTVATVVVAGTALVALWDTVDSAIKAYRAQR
ncbi:permease prefix domain 1-containing protein [Micromonospora sp. C28SCA-DRY-2]|uniref:HAAS signaling domain-containing protein n=1 Tax=Micromonospora sp. C28SCA-DRY-2 TaxID=3059522 RepID=UPI002676EC5C|nr:permease prefix domain 1-containing protein [Micromonospora sp. C28SCA-DRY-2]MDO3702720.1 permease prefix domain 1-containing protein [Micromonospora sp. C28SCA-DRY-2]MDO3704140.1 permease prefix domain 1-containing protein [Micromonospora sp. C28SCA-DRY-2]